jgi:chaperonin GroEL
MANVIGVTYGPRGRTVMLDRSAGLLSTKDGVTVAWELDPEDPLRRLGTRALQNACHKINLEAGDGTSTTAILTHAILAEAHKWVAAGENPALLAQDLQRVADLLVNADIFDILTPEPVEAGLLYEVALNASHGDEEVAKAIVDGLDMVGAEGMISVEEGKGRGIELVPKNGLEISRGLESTDFLPEGQTSLHLDTALVALVDGELTKLKDVQNILEQATQFPFPLVIVSRGCFGEALQVLVMNNGKLKRSDGQDFCCVAVRVPGHLDQQRDHLHDLASVTGSQILDPEAGDSLSKCSSEVLGSIQSTTLKRDTATFVAFEDKYELIEQRVAELERKRDRSTHSFDVEQINERIAKLTNGFCLTRVGAATQVEIRERRGRIEDALSAVRCAIEEGVVPGGGISYLQLACFLQGSLPFTAKGKGTRVLCEALRAPLRLIARNAGYEAPVVLQRVLRASYDGHETPLPSWEHGWDATTNELRDFRQSPVIADPMKVVKAVILTAISTASTLLTADVAITKKP